MTDAQNDAPKADADDKSQTPPWGDDENFDAARAWSLIQGLRADKEALRADVETLTTERDGLKSQVDEADKAAKERDAARRDLWVERAVRKHGLDDALVEFLTGDDEDAIAAKAARLAALGKPSQPADTADAPVDTPPAGDAPTTRPEPALTPGHGGETPAVFDPDAIVAAIR